MLTLDEATQTLIDPRDGRRFDARTRAWGPSDGRRRVPGRPVSLREAATWLQRASGHPLRQPVGVIGPREAPEANLSIAEAIGRAFGSIGFTVVCGGRQGIMAAVCRGVAAGGGISVGLLPETEADAANPYVTIPLATGIGEARNAIVARSGCHFSASCPNAAESGSAPPAAPWSARSP
jgi:SLOG cluster4 family